MKTSVLIAMALAVTACNREPAAECDCAAAVEAATQEALAQCSQQQAPAASDQADVAEDLAPATASEDVAEPETSLPARPALPVEPGDVDGGLSTFDISMFARPQRTLTFEAGGEELAMGSIHWSSEQWAFGRRDGYYATIAAEKDSVFVKFDFELTSTSKKAHVPQFYLVAVIDGKLLAIPMSVRFFRWDSHASYRGLEPERGNDFRFTDTVKFTAAALAPRSLVSEPMFIVTLPYACGEVFMHPARGEPEFHANLGCPDFVAFKAPKFWQWYRLVGARNMKKAFR